MEIIYRRSHQVRPKAGAFWLSAASRPAWKRQGFCSGASLALQSGQLAAAGCLGLSIWEMSAEAEMITGPSGEVVADDRRRNHRFTVTDTDLAAVDEVRSARYPAHLKDCRADICLERTE